MECANERCDRVGRSAFPGCLPEHIVIGGRYRFAPFRASGMELPCPRFTSLGFVRRCKSSVPPDLLQRLIRELQRECGGGSGERHRVGQRTSGHYFVLHWVPPRLMLCVKSGFIRQHFGELCSRLNLLPRARSMAASFLRQRRLSWAVKCGLHSASAKSFSASASAAPLRLAQGLSFTGSSSPAATAVKGASMSEDTRRAASRSNLSGEGRSIASMD